jgi:hypothetical protein
MTDAERERLFIAWHDHRYECEALCRESFYAGLDEGGKS